MFHDSALSSLANEFELWYKENNLNTMLPQHSAIEYFLPSFCNTLIQGHHAECDVLLSPDTWIGITNREDYEEAKRIFAEK